MASRQGPHGEHPWKHRHLISNSKGRDSTSTVTGPPPCATREPAGRRRIGEVDDNAVYWSVATDWAMGT